MAFQLHMKPSDEVEAIATLIPDPVPLDAAFLPWNISLTMAAAAMDADCPLNANLGLLENPIPFVAPSSCTDFIYGHIAARTRTQYALLSAPYHTVVAVSG